MDRHRGARAPNRTIDFREAVNDVNCAVTESSVAGCWIGVKSCICDLYLVSRVAGVVVVDESRVRSSVYFGCHVPTDGAEWYAQWVLT